jgi:hypothetical protein
MSDDRQLMTAAIARDLQQSFSKLMAQPARLGDIELRTAAPVHPGASRSTLAPAARPCQLKRYT